MSYLYQLEKYKTNNRYKCPNCGKSKVYTRYVNTMTGQHAPYQFGKCDRLNNCNYHKYPNNNIDVTSIAHLSTVAKPKEKPKEYLSKTDYATKLYREFENNKFVDYLCSKLGVKNADKITIDYMTGTGAEGSTLFPYFDSKGNLVTYKTMLYDVLTGRRNKEKFGRYLYQENRHPIPLYGIWLITKYPDLPIAIVEAEKTAQMMRIYNPYFLWMATGGSNMLNPSKLYPIRDKKIVLFPDQNQYEYWSNILNKIKDRYIDIDISISRECEIWYENGLIKEGEDIADYYNNSYKFDHRLQQMTKINQ
tara:strand:+ start:4282 stop:5199 length:918 start_codon:yes stop_codon:yes gene_type:complete